MTQRGNVALCNAFPSLFSGVWRRQILSCPFYIFKISFSCPQYLDSRGRCRSWAIVHIYNIFLRRLVSRPHRECTETDKTAERPIAVTSHGNVPPSLFRLLLVTEMKNCCTHYRTCCLLNQYRYPLLSVERCDVKSIECIYWTLIGHVLCS